MSEHELRKRMARSGEKLEESGKREEKTPQRKEPPGMISPRYAKTVISIFALALLIMLYRNLEVVKFMLGYSHIPTQKWQAIPSLEPGFVPDFSADLEKRDAVVSAFKHAWSAYERDAMGDDEYHPISKRGSNLTEAGGIGYTVIDSIDTMQIMGLDEEYQRARDWVANKLSFEKDGNFNTFETTIRVLGGLLSAYHLSSEDPIFLERAVDLADRILPVFDTPSGLPLAMVNLKKREGVDDPSYKGLVSTAEAATLQLEFRYLSYLTENDEYWDKAEQVMKVISKARISSGLSPIFMSAENGQFLVSEIRLGSRADSFYEYLLKQYLQTSGTERVYREMYDDAMQAIHVTLIKHGILQNLTYTVELLPERKQSGEVSWRVSPKQDHLVCFLGGSLMLGATTAGAASSPVSIPPTEDELLENGKRDWKTGYELIETCMETYLGTATGLSPEIAHFYLPGEPAGILAKKDWYIKSSGGPSPSYDARYILRPETVESLFIAFRLTGDQRYRDYGWKIFQSIEKYCRVESGGYASILDVDDVNSEKLDKMETFLMSETLKYLYLLFSEADILPLNEYVFNTEAHPLPIIAFSTRSTFGS